MRAFVTRIRQMLEMIRFSHTLFALPFALLAALMAWTVTAVWRWQDLIGIVACMVTARSAAMAFNRFVDRHIDARNPRTAQRHIPSGLLSARSVILFTMISALGFIASTVLFLPNRLPLFLSVPVLSFLFAYSYTKRFTALSHFWLGAALMLAPVCTWVAIRGEHVLNAPTDLAPALVLGGAVLLWVSGFDLIYACQDVHFDARVGLFSMPARWGVRFALRIAALCHFAMLGLLAVLPLVFPYLSWIYGIGVVAVAVLLVYEHALVRENDLSRVNLAFFHVNAVVSVGLLVVGALDLWLKW